MSAVAPKTLIASPVCITYFWPDIISKEVSSSIETSLMMCAVSLAPLLRLLLFPEFDVVETNWTEVLIAIVVLFDSNKLRMIDVVELGTV